MLTKTGSIACDYCGKFISYAQLDSGDARHFLSTPDSHFTKEEFESFHWNCRPKPDHSGCEASTIPGASCQFPNCGCD